MTENNKEVLEPYKKLGSEIENQIKTTNGGKPIKYKNHFVKFKLDSNDNPPSNKILYVLVLGIIVKSVLQIEMEYYPRILIDDCIFDSE